MVILLYFIPTIQYLIYINSVANGLITHWCASILNSGCKSNTNLQELKGTNSQEKDYFDKQKRSETEERDQSETNRSVDQTKHLFVTFSEDLIRLCKWRSRMN